ncbi:MAG: hypothetical protein AAF483_19790, partial [Planctomycetota bacterium]
MKKKTIPLLFLLCLLCVSPLQGQSVKAPNNSAALAVLAAQMEEVEGEMAVIESTRVAIAAQVEEAEVQIASVKPENTLDISSASYPEVIKTLQARRIQLTIDLAGLEARQEAIRKAQASASEKVSEAVVPMMKLVELQEKDLQRARKLAMEASISQAEISQFEQKLLEARIRLAESQRAQPRYKGLNDTLLSTQLSIAEKRAQLEKCESLLGQF